MVIRTLTAVLLAAGFVGVFSPLPVAADRLVLKDGQSYEGRLVQETGSEVALEIIVQGQIVKLTVPRAHIQRHDKVESLLERYLVREAAVDTHNAGAQADLAEWCRDRGLSVFALKHAREAVRITPDQKTAGEVLRSMGYIRSKDGWITEDEAQREKGLELWRGRWRPKAEVERLRAEQDLTNRREILASISQSLARNEKEQAGLRTRLEVQKREIVRLEEGLKTQQMALGTKIRLFQEARQRLLKAITDEKEGEEAAFLIGGGILTWSQLVDPATREKKQAIQDLIVRIKAVALAESELEKASRQLDMSRPLLTRSEQELEKLKEDAERLMKKAKALDPAIQQPESEDADSSGVDTR